MKEGDPFGILKINKSHSAETKSKEGLQSGPDLHATLENEENEKGNALH